MKNFTTLTPVTKGLAAATGFMLVLGSFLPWFTINAGFFSLTVSGIDSGYGYHEGLLTLIGGVCCLAAFFFAKQYLFGLAAMVTLFVGLWNLNQINTVADEVRVEDIHVTVAPSLGLIMVLMGSLLGVILTFFWKDEKSLTKAEANVFYAGQWAHHPDDSENMIRWWDARRGHWTEYTAER